MAEELKEQEEDKYLDKNIDMDKYWQTFLVPLHPLHNIKITNYFNYKPRFNGVFSRNNIPRIKDGTYVINLDDKKNKGTHWVLTFIDRKKAVYFDSLGIEYIPQKVLNKIKDKSIIHNIYRIQHNNYVMWGFYCIVFIEYMLAGKTLLDCTNLFFPNGYKKNEKIIYEYFKGKYFKSWF